MFMKNDPKTKEWSAKGNKAKAEIKEKKFKWIVGRGMEKATEVINKMLDGETVTAQQAQAVQLLEKFVGYEKARKQSVEAKVEGDINHKVDQYYSKL